MRLLTKELEKRFAEVGSQEGVKDPLVIAKFFYPTGLGIWYATAYDPDIKAFFVYESIFGDENDGWSFISLDELEFFIGEGGLHIERDLDWHEVPISKVIK